MGKRKKKLLLTAGQERRLAEAVAEIVREASERAQVLLDLGASPDMTISEVAHIIRVDPNRRRGGRQIPVTAAELWEEIQAWRARLRALSHNTAVHYDRVARARGVKRSTVYGWVRTFRKRGEWPPRPSS